MLLHDCKRNNTGPRSARRIPIDIFLHIRKGAQQIVRFKPVGSSRESISVAQFLLVKSGRRSNFIDMQATAVSPNSIVERPGFFLNGALVMVLEVVLVLGGLALILSQALGQLAGGAGTGSPPIGLLPGFALILLALLILRGFRLMRRDQALVLYSGPKYLGTIKGGGLFWTNPFVSRRKLSLQAHPSTVQHPFDGTRSLTANVIWQVTDTAKALELSDHYDLAVQQAIAKALAETLGKDDLDLFKKSLERHLGQIGASVRRVELRSGRVAL
jgi:hypothetical protein